MKQLYRILGTAGLSALLYTTPLLAASPGSMPAAEALRTESEISAQQDLFISAPADLEQSVDWEECSVLIEHEALGTPTIPAECSGCTISRDTDDDNEFYAYYYPGTTIITWTVTDAQGNQASDTQRITVSDTQAPIFPSFQPDFFSAEAEPGQCQARVTFDEPGASDNCGLPSIRLVSGNYTSGDYFPVGTTSLVYEAADESGNTEYFTLYIYVEDKQAPVFTTLPEPITRAADPGSTGATFTLPPLTATDNCTYYEIRNNAPATFPIGTTLVTWTAVDSYENAATVTQLVTVTGSDCPAISLDEIRAPQAAQPVNSRVAVEVSVLEGGEISSVVWHWGDGMLSEGIQSADLIVGEHRYSKAGIYTIELFLENTCGETASLTYEHLVVYDPAAGFLTGGGWFNSPAGAWLNNPAVSGKAHFSLTSKYHKNPNTPQGNFVFKLQTGNLDFKGTSQQWLLVDKHQALYRGMGTLNGMSGYRYLVSVIDGGMAGKKATDKIRIMLWKPAGGLVYDNQPGAPLAAEAMQALGGGSIVIHNGKQKDTKHAKTAEVAAAGESASLLSGLAAYPNPLAAEGLWLQLPAVDRHQTLKALVYDMSGRIMAEKSFTVAKDAGHYHWPLDHSAWAQGVYLLVIRGDQYTQQLKLTK